MARSHSSTVYLLTLTGLLLSAAVTEAAPKTWKQVGRAITPKFSYENYDGLLKVSLALNPADHNRPYVAYSSSDTGFTFYAGVKKLVGPPGANWAAVGGKASRGTAVDISLAIDPSGTPWVAFFDDTAENKLSVAAFEGGKWVSKGYGITDNEAHQPSLTFDGSEPVVAFQDAGQNSQPTVLKYNSNKKSWAPVGKKGFKASAPAVGYITLAAKEGRYYVAFEDFYDRSRRGAVWHYTSRGWEQLGKYFSEAMAIATSVVVSPKDASKPYVAFTDYKHGRKTSVVVYANGAWKYLGQRGIAGVESNYNSLAFGSDGTLYLATQCRSKSALCVFRYNSSIKKWVPLGPQPLTSGGATHISLQVAGTTPYVAYRDKAQGGKLFVKAFQ